MRMELLSGLPRRTVIGVPSKIHRNHASMGFSRPHRVPSRILIDGSERRPGRKHDVSCLADYAGLTLAIRSGAWRLVDEPSRISPPDQSWWGTRLAGRACPAQLCWTGGSAEPAGQLAGRMPNWFERPNQFIRCFWWPITSYQISWWWATAERQPHTRLEGCGSSRARTIRSPSPRRPPHYTPPPPPVMIRCLCRSQCHILPARCSSSSLLAPPAKRSVVGWRLGAMCYTHAGLGLVPGIRLLYRLG